jgi:hypothetical protein
MSLWYVQRIPYTYLASSPHMGCAVSLQSLLWWTTQKVCTGRRRHQDHWTMPLITISRTLWSIPHSCEDLAKWICLANYVWRHKILHPEMWSVSDARECQFKGCYASYQQPLDKTLQCLGNRLHDTFFKVKELWVHLGGNLLCLQVDGSHACRAANAKNSKKMFEEIIFPWFGVSRMVISDGGAHFTNITTT